MHGRHIRTRFGITLEEYDKMLRQQKGRCAICRRPPKTHRLSVDHIHGTKIIRGLLCVRCNRGIGLFWDDPEIFLRVVDYLRKERE
jgi:hypothetical protein